MMSPTARANPSQMTLPRFLKAMVRLPHRRHSCVNRERSCTQLPRKTASTLVTSASGDRATPISSARTVTAQAAWSGAYRILGREHVGSDQRPLLRNRNTARYSHLLRPRRGRSGGGLLRFPTQPRLLSCFASLRVSPCPSVFPTGPTSREPKFLNNPNTRLGRSQCRHPDRSHPPHLGWGQTQRHIHRCCFRFLDWVRRCSRSAGSQCISSVGVSI